MTQEQQQESASAKDNEQIDANEEMDHEEEEVEMEMEMEMEEYLTNLCILPPKTTNSHITNEQLAKDAIVLPPLSPQEPVSAIRNVLSEIRGYAHFTNYRLVVEEMDEELLHLILQEHAKKNRNGNGHGKDQDRDQGADRIIKSGGGAGAGGDGNVQQSKGKKKKKNKKSQGHVNGNTTAASVAATVAVAPSQIVSPYTTDPSSISMSISNTHADADDDAPHAASEIILNDYDDLASLMSFGQDQDAHTHTQDTNSHSQPNQHQHPHSLQSGMGIRIVLEKYDLGKVHDHVNKVRWLLDGNAPSLLAVAGTGAGNGNGNGNGNGGNDHDNGASDGANVENEVLEEKVDEEEDAKKNAKADESSASASASPSKQSNAEAEGDEAVTKTKTKAEEAKKEKMEIDPDELAIPPFAHDTVSLTNRIPRIQDFFYLAAGAEDRLAHIQEQQQQQQQQPQQQSQTSANANAKSKKAESPTGSKNGNTVSEVESRRKAKLQEMQSYNEELVALEERMRVRCSISHGGFHPPPPGRKMVGDLAYLEVRIDGAASGGNGGNGVDGAGAGATSVVHVTAVPAGFYVNRSGIARGGHGHGNGSANGSGNGFGGDAAVFDPRPADQPCFSHSLLDCLLLKSSVLRNAWAGALSAAMERSERTAKESSTLEALFRASTYCDLAKNANPNQCQKVLDSITIRPSWLVPAPHPKSNKGKEANISSNQYQYAHTYNTIRSEVELTKTHGLDLRNGASRDWNEELQSARELPSDTLDERIDRARIIHKTLCDFGDAAIAGVMAVATGQIGPMNPHENTRSHVYLHNNIFFSRAVDSGVDTFKLIQGDRSARKAASKDAQCVGVMHKLDIPGMHTLATVLVDYLGTRMVCQSIVPGILLGYKSHQVMYGAVEASSPLAWDKGLHEKLEENLGKSLMIASRKVLKVPLSDERMEHVSNLRVEEDDGAATEQEDASEAKSEEGAVTDFFGSMEFKCIRGSDHRDYCLDVTRLTPRDANWVPKDLRGTGNWETCMNNKTSSGRIPSNLDDDEFVMAVLRPELIMRFTTKKMREYKDAKEVKANEDAADKNGTKEGEGTKKSAVAKEDLEYLKTLRFNLNVFLPHLKSIEDVDKDAFEQLKKDEELTAEISKYLWDSVLPQITREVRETPSQIPVDGKKLTEFLHERGVNCRYLGRLALMALEEEDSDSQEEKDLVTGKVKEIKRRTIPQSWLESLECEMVARAAKHVLDKYYAENGERGALQPSKTAAYFLSALMSTSEESAADTERRLAREDDNDNDPSSSFTLFDGVWEGDRIRSRDEIWSDIENEIGRRFRYSLKLYNNKDPKAVSRTSLYPLLRRVCQRSGIRLYAKNYTFGAKGLISANSSYPIAASDIADIVPLLKHAAHDGSAEGFIPCANGADAANASLYILLNDAKHAQDAATMLLNDRDYTHAVEYSQEATNLFQRVTESPYHIRVSKCMDLTTLILLQAQEMEMSAAHAAKALGISIQIGGFDSADVVSSHITISHILLNSGHLASSIRHLRAVLYLTEFLAGSHHPELSTLYHKIGSIYDEIGNVSVAHNFIRVAMGRKNNDRVFQAVLNKQLATVYAKLGQLQMATEMEKQTYSIFKITLGESHEFTKSSKETLEHYFQAATEQGKQLAAERKKMMEEAEANKIGDELVASEIAEQKKKKKKKSKSKSKKKK